MDFGKRACTIVNADKGCGVVTLQDDNDGTFIIARVRDDSPVNLNQLFGVTSGLDLIGKEVNIDLLMKKIYTKGGNDKKEFARYNFQLI